MTYYGKWEIYTPTEGNLRAICYKNEDGLDWFTLTKGIMQWNEIGGYVSSSTGENFIAVADNGFIAGKNRDVSALIPENLHVYGIDPTLQCEPGQFYNDGEVTDAPEVEYVTEVISDRQFFQGLAARGLITEDEALDAVGPGVIPAQMNGLISQLPADQQFSAKMLIRGATTFERSNSLAAVIGVLYGWDSDDLDEFWNYAATL